MNQDYPQDVVLQAEDIALSLWQNGELVVVPTETVYGLAADGARDDAVAKIYALKDRPKFNPLIAHVADIEMAKRYVQWNKWAEKLARACWPGPLSMVLPLLPEAPISALATDGAGTLAVRVPAIDITRRLIARFGGALVAPSANRSMRVSPTCADHVRDEFAGACPYIIDGGACRVGIESSVVDLSGDVPVLLRPGYITQAMLEEILSEPVRLHDGAGGTLKSPGLMARHYAPSTPLRLNAQHVEDGEALLAFGEPLSHAGAVVELSRTRNLEEAAANLFAGLRTLDAFGARAIAVMPIPESGIGAAINDRLRRAASDSH